MKNGSIYEAAQNLTFCHVCITAMKTGKLQNHGHVEVVLIECEYCNWKDMLVVIRVLLATMNIAAATKKVLK